MIDMDPEVRRARDLSRDAAVDLRSRALAIDTDPDAMDAHLGSPAFAMIRRSTTPVEFREPDPDGLPALPDRGSCLQGVVGFLELARGDVAAVLACPSPALAGEVIPIRTTAAAASPIPLIPNIVAPVSCWDHVSHKGFASPLSLASTI